VPLRISAAHAAAVWLRPAGKAGQQVTNDYGKLPLYLLGQHRIPLIFRHNLGKLKITRRREIPRCDR
jgi:hypothetical protein